ncbi:chorismate synthase [Candidatus Methylacidiphilum infernorum]|uniref:Chorismate synthase n=1 Tax=Methylacidiphilum infernorum (isolate V4) TaxID=481448 RepID=AROC_METI4|nr:chorismate synthase [Candidatus Methylacidiphilum infernorum]B3DXL0.1 RecName: Full=Chorismate synthase; Short=CS; AltName: Full=5-enolpyruvylshikimate-3-phosphate phospholyase [Methylacidiphilum infernorum V4]ACD82244.1 Chorismate synthase [Methylacidiphilum infernorum V4]
MPNTFGHLFRITTWGESHGKGVGVVIDGCPPRIPLSEEDIQKELDRRRPGQSKITTQRKERDIAAILSGTFNGMTLGTPIMIWVKNEDARPEAYAEMEKIYRPSHADFTYQAKYGIRNWQGGGRSSARETIGRVAGGAVGGKVLQFLYPEIEVIAWVSEVHGLKSLCDPNTVTREDVESNILRWPNAENLGEALKEIERAQKEGDTVGGIVECIVRGMPVGLGEPVFDKLEADLAKAMLSLPASKGFEIGSGFRGALMRGSEHNDPFYMEGNKVRTKTNWSGGVQGGISNGENLYFRVAFKPVATIAQEQQTVSVDGEEVILRARGRHDPCVLPRAVPIVEAMTKLVLVDHALRQKAIELTPRSFS